VRRCLTCSGLAASRARRAHFVRSLAADAPPVRPSRVATLVSSLRAWPFYVVMLVAIVWMGFWVAVFAGPWIQAERWMRKTAEQTGIAAVSGSIASALGQLAVVFVPPLMVFVAWLIVRRS